MKFAAITALLSAEAFKLNNSRFATMPEDQGENKEQVFAMTAAKLNSGVRARWVELPDCNNEGPLNPGEVALKDDLSNASIATCKSYMVSHDRYGRLTDGEPTAQGVNAATRATDRGIWEGLGKDAYSRLPIYDPVMHEEGSMEEYDAYYRPLSWRIPSHEHQVTQQANGTVEATYEIPESPNGDW